MYRHSRLVGILGCAASLAIVGCSANSGMTPTSGSAATSFVQHAAPTGPDWIREGKVVYSKPHYFPTREMAAARKVNPDTQFTYYGGPLLVNPKTYLILWGYQTYGDPDNVAKLLKTYLKNEGGSKHNNIYTQYYETVSGQNIYVTNPKKQLAGVWDDETDAVPANPTDAQVAAEANVGVTHFGFDPNGSYIVATPNGRNSAGSARSGVPITARATTATSFRTRTCRTCPTPATLAAPTTSKVRPRMRAEPTRA